ncbi:MAG: hypothetical protein MI810_16875 [Flavobacteriales bacterium]|nr:hypothetical protein [Flavobacteriales bacterium]
MLVEESKWIQKALETEFKEGDFPLLNVGSSRLVFRTETQPHIHNNIFAPLEKKGLKVLHTDIKDDEGVDLVGDLNQKEFREKLSDLGVKSVLCSNLLEHLPQPQLICDSILEVLSTGDKIIVTVPYNFPFHNDPIDTMLRPNIQELSAMFPNTKVLDSAIVEQDRCFWDDLKANKRFMLIMFVRWSIPFYKFSEWKYMIKDLFRLKRKYSATAILLEKC